MRCQIGHISWWKNILIVVEGEERVPCLYIVNIIFSAIIYPCVRWSDLAASTITRSLSMQLPSRAAQKRAKCGHSEKAFSEVYRLWNCKFQKGGPFGKSGLMKYIGHNRKRTDGWKSPSYLMKTVYSSILNESVWWNQW